MTREFLDHDPLTGLTTYHEYDEATDTTILHYEQANLDDHLRFNRETQNTDRYRADPNFWHAAHIPPVVIMQWKADYGVDVFNKDHWPKVRQLLNSSEWKGLRTGLFRI